MSSEIQVKVPVLPESVQDATIATWHKKPGDHVKRDENLVDLETDKVVLEVPAPADGVLQDIFKSEGETVVGEELLANINNAAGAESKPNEEEKQQQSEAKSTTSTEESAPPKSTTSTEESAPPKSPEQTTKDTAELGPSARRAANELNANVKSIVGSGKDGRVTKQDVLSQVTISETSPEPAADVANITTDSSTARPEKRVAMTRLRARIAERLVASQKTAAILSTFNEINMQPVMNIRAKYKEQFEKAHGIKLGFMSFFIKATVEALKRFPAVNASIDGNDVVYHGYFDIGVAVSSERGLVVPIIRDAHTKSMAQLEEQIRDFGARAQAGQISIDEMTGGTFTISNGGVFGSLLSTPIINPPQSGILGMHKIEKRPVVENEQIVIRPMMYVALSYDHRIIDGKESVSFLKTIKELLEDPTRLLLDV